MSEKTAPDETRADLSQSLYDGSNALYLEQLYARYRNGDRNLDAAWLSYFAALDAEEMSPAPHTPSWQRTDWPPAVNGELTSALDANWQDEGLPSPRALGGKIEARLDGAGY